MTSQASNEVKIKAMKEYNRYRDAYEMVFDYILDEETKIAANDFMLHYINVTSLEDDTWKTNK